IATNSSRDEFNKRTTKLIKFGNKYKTVLECMSLTPNECLVFEDSPHAVYDCLPYPGTFRTDWGLRTRVSRAAWYATSSSCSLDTQEMKLKDKLYQMSFIFCA
ncbi:4345_t:CDS:2, partial [Gigaspora margarita]